MWNEKEDSLMNKSDKKERLSIIQNLYLYYVIFYFIVHRIGLREITDQHFKAVLVIVGVIIGIVLMILAGINAKKHDNFEFFMKACGIPVTAVFGIMILLDFIKISC